MPKFAANLSFLFQELDFLDRFEAAARVGFQGVEYITPYDHDPSDIVARLQTHQLTQVLFNLPAGDWQANERGVAALPGREHEFDQGLAQALTYAQALGCHQLHAMAGIPPVGESLVRCEAVYIQNLRRAAEALQPHGIRLLIEPINDRDMPGYFLNTCAYASRIIEAVEHENLSLQMDLYHCQVMSGDLAQNIFQHYESTAHYQIAGNPDRHEPDVGEINYPYLFELIDQLGYEGWIGCEYHPMRETTAGLTWAHTYGLGR